MKASFNIEKAITVIVSLTFFLLFSCETDKAEETSVTHNDIPQTSDTVEIFPVLPDTFCYVGYVYRFTNSTDLYTPVYCKVEIGKEIYDKLLHLSDSVLYEDKEGVRRLVPKEIAAKYFDLSSLDSVAVYDTVYTHVGKARFSHVELYDDMLESHFVAVFHSQIGAKVPVSFCIGKDKFPAVEGFHVSHHKMDAKVQDALRQGLELDTGTLWDVHHYALAPYGTILTAISGDTTAFLVQDAEREINIQYKSKQAEMILDVTPIPREVNGKPVLLTSFAIPQSDVFWEGLLVFDGTRFELAPRSRF